MKGDYFFIYFIMKGLVFLRTQFDIIINIQMNPKISKFFEYLSLTHLIADLQTNLPLEQRKFVSITSSSDPEWRMNLEKYFKQAKLRSSSHIYNQQLINFCIKRINFELKNNNEQEITLCLKRILLPIFNTQSKKMQKVFLIRCKNCQTLLNQRGQSIKLISNPNKNGFSSNCQSEMIKESYVQEKFQFCDCKINRISCKKCEQQCGYHVTSACNVCLPLSNLHYWIFLEAKGELTNLKWGDLNLTDNDFYNWLHDSKIGDETIQILRSEQIKNKEQLKYINDQVLSQKGIKLGEICRLRMLINQ